jgi:hypothetical protein
VRAELVVAMAVAVAACGPVRTLTRPEGNGGWTPERRADELARSAVRARVDLAPVEAPPPAPDTPLGLADVVQLASVESLRLAEADQDVAIATRRRPTSSCHVRRWPRSAELRRPSSFASRTSAP